MAGLLDTSAIVRYLTADPPEQGHRAAGVIDGTEDVAISPTAMVETAHVLLTVYGVPREKIVDLLLDLLLKENVVTFGADKGLLARALLMCRPSGRVSFPDAALWAEARSAGIQRTYTFDRRFPSEGLELGAQAPWILGSNPDRIGRKVRFMVTLSADSPRSLRPPR